MENPLDIARREIQNVDAKIQALLEERAILSLRVGAYKKEAKSSIIDLTREHILYEQYGTVQEYSYHSVWREIFAVSKRIQGFVCYTTNCENILYAKICLGFATDIQYCAIENMNKLSSTEALFIEKEHYTREHGYVNAVYTISYTECIQEVKEFVLLTQQKPRSIQEIGIIV